MSKIQKIYDYLKECNGFFFASCDGDKPRVRPFGFMMIFEDKLYFGMGTHKESYKQVKANPNVEICAMNPAFLDKSDVDQSTLDKEKEILMVQAKEDPKNASKPENIIEKMVMGRIGKYYEENCLLQQEFVKDNSMSVEQYIAACAKELGGTITFKNAVRFEKGEGIEKKQENFAAEIASMVNGNK